MKSATASIEPILTRARRGEKFAFSFPREHADLIFPQLVREGIKIAMDCLDQIRDPELREKIRTVFLTTTAGALLGGVVGGVMAGPAGTRVGAVVGGGLGLIVGVAVITVWIEERGNRVVVRIV